MEEITLATVPAGTFATADADGFVVLVTPHGYAIRLGATIHEGRLVPDNRYVPVAALGYDPSVGPTE